MKVTIEPYLNLPSDFPCGYGARVNDKYYCACARTFPEAKKKLLAVLAAAIVAPPLPPAETIEI